MVKYQYKVANSTVELSGKSLQKYLECRPQLNRFEAHLLATVQAELEAKSEGIAKNSLKYTELLRQKIANVELANSLALHEVNQTREKPFMVKYFLGNMVTTNDGSDILSQTI